MKQSNRVENESLTSETEVVVNFPDKLELSMVQSNELRHYELFQWLVTILLPIAVGFWTAYFTLETKTSSLWWSALIFTSVSFLFVGLAFFYRKKVFHESIRKSVNLSELK